LIFISKKKKIWSHSTYLLDTSSITKTCKGWKWDLLWTFTITCTWTIWTFKCKRNPLWFNHWFEDISY
jgi:hypothetical protein